MTDESSALLRQAALFAAHPDFDRVVATYAVALARFREAPRLVNLIAATDVRWTVIGFLFYLDADRERFGPEGGATYSRLLETCMKRGEASPRAVKSVLALLKFARLVQVVPSRADRRIKFYRPTPRLFEFLRDWMRYGTAALDILEPEAQRGAQVADDGYLNAFSVSGGRAHLEDAVPLVERVPTPLSALKSMLGSYSVIVAMIVAHLDGQPMPSRHAIGKRFGLSKSQVGNVLAAGLSEGLFAADATAGFVPTPALMASFRDWISIEMAFYARHMRPLHPPSALPAFDRVEAT